MSTEFPVEYLEDMWNGVDWEAAERKLMYLQRQLSLAAYRKDDSEIEELQKRIVRDTDIKCLAVRHVVSSTMSPGVDNVKWRTPAEKMQAALSLTSKGYRASPLRQILIVAKNTGKERRPCLPTYYDRAMSVLYGYSLIPVTEAMAERKSFAFRPCRSTQDAHAYVMDALIGHGSPRFIVCGDIKAYYAHIQHTWLLANVPMDKGVLHEFLNAGIVFAGELFPAEETGISEGSNISPYLGNFVLDGMQKYIYQELHGTTAPKDYGNGNLIRFADDILVTARTMNAAHRIIEILQRFLAERGLILSEEKTKICKVDDGFTFLSRTYARKNGLIVCTPSEKAVERFIDDLRQTISMNRKSQRDLILLLNRKLKGWAGYHRYSNATEAFRRIDTAVQAALLEAMIEKHPKWPLSKIQEKYWYKDKNGRFCYALPDDKTIRLGWLADTLLLTHNKIKTNANPFVDREYIEYKTHEREMQNVTGAYRAVWERQNGLCYYCGRPILDDQFRTTVPLNLKKPPSVRNSVYIHKLCAVNEFQLVRTMEDISILRPYDVYSILEGIVKTQKEGRMKKSITPEWKHYKLKCYFAARTSASITLTFSKIEEIDSSPLPPSARKSNNWWYPRKNCNMIAEAWITEGYEMHSLDVKKEKITLHRREDGVSRLVVPDVLTQGKLPDDAIYELETHMDYIITKYGLKGVGKRRTKISE